MFGQPVSVICPSTWLPFVILRGFLDIRREVLCHVTPWILKGITWQCAHQAPRVPSITMDMFSPIIIYGTQSINDEMAQQGAAGHRLMNKGM